MHLGRHNKRDDYTLYEKILEESQKEKDLGVIIDEQLKFHVQAAAATKKANQMLGIIKKTYTSRDAVTMATLYKAMVRPHLEYGNVIWGPSFQGDIIAVERIQRRATRLIPELKNMPYQERLMNLKLPTLVYRRKRGDMIMMFKIMCGLVRIDVNKLFTNATIKKTRGHSKKVFKRHAIKTVRKHFFSQRIVNDWNSLPEHVVEAPSTLEFKKRLDHHWKDQYFTL